MALVCGVILVAIVAGPSAAEPVPPPPPPYDTPTVIVDAEWGPFDDLLFNYIATTSLDPVGNRFDGDFAWHVAGCGADAILGEPLVPLVVRSEGPHAAENVEAGAGTWSLVVVSAGYCAYFDAAGNPDEPRYDAVVARYPVGTPVAVALTVRAYAPGEAAPATTDTMVFDVPVETDVPDTAVLFGTFELPAVPGGGDAEGATPADAEAADAPDGGDPGGAGSVGTDGVVTPSGATERDYAVLLIVLVMLGLGWTLAAILRWFLTRSPPPAPVPDSRGTSVDRSPASSGSPTRHVDLPSGTLGWEEGRGFRLGGGRYRIGARQDGWVSVRSEQPGGDERWFWVSEETVFPPR